jgi:site-specific DNA-methyltransferase (adenine-specific)
MDSAVYQGNGAAMTAVADGSAGLVLTSPPYWPPAVEPKLHRLPAKVGVIEDIENEILTFALAQRPVFTECARVLAASGTLVVQTRDVRLRDRLVPVASIHREQITAAGLHLFTRYLWNPSAVEPDRRSEADAAAANGLPRPVDAEEFLVFRRPGAEPIGPAISAEDLQSLGQPVLVSSRGRLREPHPHQSPLPIAEMFVRAFSRPGDLVVDPYMGHGTMLKAAQRLGRSFVGYDVDERCVAAARSNLELH